MIIRIFTIIIFCFIPLIAQINTGTISIKMNKNSVTIINDSIFYSNSFSENYLYGKYKIVVKENSKEWGSESNIFEIILNEENPNFHKEITFSKKNFIDSNPSNAKVILNDSVIGYTPLSLSLNSQNIIIEKDNFKSVFINPVKEINTVELEKFQLENNNSFLETYLFETLIGTAVALGATAAYYKIEADKKYDDYLKTRDKSLIDKTEKLDLISGISFSLLQINFGALIYLFLTSD